VSDTTYQQWVPVIGRSLAYLCLTTGQRNVAKRQSGKAAKKSVHSPQPVSSEEKIARLLGMIVIKEMQSRGDQATLLRSVGFEIADVASMLGMSENHVKVATHHGRKKRKARPAKRSKG